MIKAWSKVILDWEHLKQRLGKDLGQAELESILSLFKYYGWDKNKSFTVKRLLEGNPYFPVDLGSEFAVTFSYADVTELRLDRVPTQHELRTMPIICLECAEYVDCEHTPSISRCADAKQVRNLGYLLAKETIDENSSK